MPTQNESNNNISSMSKYKWIGDIEFLLIYDLLRNITIPTNGELEILFRLFLYGWNFEGDTADEENPKFLVKFIFTIGSDLKWNL